MLRSWCLRTRRSQGPNPFIRRSITNDTQQFQPGDLVLLRQKLDRNAPPILTRPLKPGRQINSHKGVIPHEAIIGKAVRDVVSTAPSKSGNSPGTEYRLHTVKLEEYVRLSRRLVTPIYPADANVIVDLLDLHIEPFDAQSEDAAKLDILEAGTGHGALTLYLSRAIHAANPLVLHLDFEQNDDDASQTALKEWKETRRAVIHTIDWSARFSAHAQTVVRNFRRGQYYHNIDFHVGDVGAWTSKALAERDNEPFLSHAFLDLPNADGHLVVVARALKTDGCAIVFNPSITQIIECVKRIKDEAIPLELETVIELGVNGSSGGREWNVRAVQPRARKVDVVQAESEGDSKDEDSSDDSGVQESEDDQRHDPNRWSMICRPKVGDRIAGGGFLGVWRKQRDMR